MILVYGFMNRERHACSRAAPCAGGGGVGIIVSIFLSGAGGRGGGDRVKLADARRHRGEEITLRKTRVNGATPAAAARGGRGPTLVPSERVAYSSRFTEPCRLRAAHASCV